MGNGIQRKGIDPAPDFVLRILTLRGEKVILDSDLALIYGVPTKRLNEQLRRNRKKFPLDFAFQLTTREFSGLMSQGAADKGFPPNWSQFATGSPHSNLKSQIATSSLEHGGRRKLPWAFTEHGALMAASVLSSQRAVDMSVYVIRAFVRMRRELSANETVARRLAEIEKTLMKHDGALRGLYEKIRPLLLPPPEPKRREIGFHVKSDEPPKSKGKTN
jgi:hypothetical protein